MDASNCIHLLCEWQGVGKQCKSAMTLQKNTKGYYFDFEHDDESDADFLARLKADFPLNSFTIVNNVELGNMCGRKRLWCNGAQQIWSDDAFDQFFIDLQNPIPQYRTKLHCQTQVII